MHLRPVRNAAASRAERNRTDPGTAHIRAIHTHATPMRATYLQTPMPIPFSLCHSPDLTDPPHATNTLHIHVYVRRPRCTHADSSRILCTRCPTAQPPPPSHPPPGGGGGGNPLSPLRTGGRGAQTPELRPLAWGRCVSREGGEDCSFPCARSHPTRRVGGGGRGGLLRPPLCGWCRSGSNPKARKP